jgi:hypothetical protein
MALDPFHDYDYAVAGLPDELCEPSVVRVVKKQSVISKPAAFPAGNWDVYFVVLPFLTQVSMTNASGFNLLSSTDPASVYGSDGSYSGNFGTVTAICVPSGTPWYGDQINSLTYNCWAYNVFHSFHPSDSSIPSRLIGGGFEVHNTTAEMYKQGTVTVADFATSKTSTLIKYRQLTASKVGVGVPDIYRAPPAYLSGLYSAQNARSWDAADGLYSRIPVSVENPYRTALSGPGVLFDAQGAANGSTTAPALNMSCSADGDPLIIPAYMSACCGMTLAAFTGLSDVTTLSLSSVMFVESCPTLDSSELALATPSAGFDPMALELYKNAACSLPPGVPVGLNPKGEWWAMAVKTLGEALKFAAGPLAAVPGYGAVLSAGATAAGALADVTSKHISSKAKSTKETAKQNAKPQKRKVKKKALLKGA